MKTQEKDFSNELQSGFYKYDRNCFYYHIPDAERTGNKPFDVIFDNGRSFYFELKWIAPNRLSFKPSSIFKPHQIRYLNKLNDISRKSYTCALAIIKQPHKGCYIIKAKDLLKQKIRLCDYSVRNLKKTIEFFYKGVNGA